MFNIYECCSNIIARQYGVLINREKTVFEDVDIEDIHEMRVAVRRIRSAFRSFRPCISQDHRKFILKDLKCLARVLGKVRDLDIAIAFFKDYDKRFPDNKGVSFLIKYCKKRRKARKKVLFSFLRSKRYLTLKENFVCFNDYLKDNVDKGVEVSVQKDFYRSFEPIIEEVFSYKEVKDLLSSDLELHDLRIAIKYLRYNLEFIDLDSKEATNIVKILRNYQNILGLINDYNIMAERVTGVARKSGLKRPEKEGVKRFLSYLNGLKNEEKNNLVLPWDVLSFEEIKTLYLPDVF